MLFTCRMSVLSLGLSRGVCAGLAAGWGHMPPFVSPARSSGLLLDLTAARAPALLLRSAVSGTPHIVPAFRLQPRNHAPPGSGCPGVLRNSRRSPKGGGDGAERSGSLIPSQPCQREIPGGAKKVQAKRQGTQQGKYPQPPHPQHRPARLAPFAAPPQHRNAPTPCGNPGPQ